MDTPETQWSAALEDRLSARARSVSAGERGELLALAQSIPDVITLARGDPDFATPSHIVKAAQEALEQGATHYTHWAGTAELRQAIARKLAVDNNIEVDPETEVVVTAGGTEGMYIVCTALLDPGDEVLVADPHYQNYDAAIALAGGKLVAVPTRLEDNFEITVDMLERYWSPKTKILLLVSPNNPTGAVLSPAAIRSIGEWAKQKDLVIVSDEIYEKLIYDDFQHLSVASVPGMRERTITLNGFSKTYAMTGWRVGYLAAPSKFVRALEPLKGALTICAPAVSQAAALAALTGPQDCVTQMRQSYDERRRMLMGLFDEFGIPYGYPKGSIFLLAGVPVSGVSAMDFCRFLLREARVLVLPGSAYGEAGRGFLRFSLVQPTDRLGEAVDRIREASGRLKLSTL